MGWSIGFDKNWNRDIGYGVPAICDHPRCDTEIDRGLSYVCGGEPKGGERGCGLYFCDKHLKAGAQERFVPLCDRCSAGEFPFIPKPDSAEWINHKLTDASWAEWRAAHPEAVTQMAAVTSSEVQS